MNIDKTNRSSKPMKDYNKSSSVQLKLIQNGFDNLKILTENIKLSGNKLTIGDLGCSHGKNSMTAINQLLELIENSSNISNKLKNLYIYHEDLDSNDFNQVHKCLDDKSISYLNNRYIINNSIVTDVQFLPKSFYEPLFDYNSIDIIMCYSSIHWLPKYKSLTSGIVFQEIVETPENVKWFKNLGKDCLTNWLSLRYKELSPNGLITLNIMESNGIDERINPAWDEYIATKGFTHADLNKVNSTSILRSTTEIDEALFEFNGKFKILRKYLSKEIYTFDRNHLNAVLSQQIIKGLESYTNLFPTTESRSEFFENYMEFLYSVKNCPSEMEIGFVYLVLQKI
ncbi:S-adenosyl-L-methionine-dependent methyltransferase [Conidiobolus coronatus NRRL 28638]|uniref:S-adenosyl-L-methionine-dependent methyltransferase n=1 Tax=Conidiobolus coronatus (strain ATCC 28846 / CBS 209.66 / NRRL 28638) TaxID=796925 RepID=A0A137NZ70_CONC2|nr:S-adenosyl-L-methionine-dependent methyltransferase [Conidiobolus coronatus NRRL 28638]|eukprot:KXN67941.1 S-adenosyl-L-methionine-dependent methyltransferase [Conidiobolus coronatus NRRL 28638]